MTNYCILPTRRRQVISIRDLR